MASTETCYWPNGTASNLDDNTTGPCPRPSGRAHGMCCTLIDVSSPDFCDVYPNGEYNGLCMAGMTDSNLWRNGCTDKNLGADCLNLCNEGEAYLRNGHYEDMANVNAPITHCGNGMYCCGRGRLATDCCRNGDGYYIVNVSHDFRSYAFQCEPR